MLIKKLSDMYAPSGIEDQVRKTVIKELSAFYPDYNVDNLGNLIVHKPGSKKTIAITAPMDELSFLVINDSDESSVTIDSLSAVKKNVLENISLTDKNDKVYICNNVKGSDEFCKLNSIKAECYDMCKVKKHYSKSLSEQLVYTTQCISNSDYIIGKALERSVACSILCNLARNLVDSMFEYYFIFSSQNYCDRKGACVATNGLKIDELYNLCGIDEDANENVKCGDGIVIILRDKKYVSSENFAEKFSKYNNKQLFVTNDYVCEGGCYFRQKDTKNCISVAFPIKHMHAPNEIVKIEDIKYLEKTILEIILP